VLAYIVIVKRFPILNGPSGPLMAES
jgi:hypothetical protein